MGVQLWVQTWLGPRKLYPSTGTGTTSLIVITGVPVSSFEYPGIMFTIFLLKYSIENNPSCTQ